MKKKRAMIPGFQIRLQDARILVWELITPDFNFSGRCVNRGGIHLRILYNAANPEMATFWSN